ncbi:MAG: tetraacyldisaccharide 4'-kinase [Marinosulfonomonas sp.]
MKQPGFWSRPPDSPGPMATLLRPLAALYAAGTARRLTRDAYKASLPVICIGNINIGGTGKTPTAIALLLRLQQQGHQPHIVSRGYGGRLEGPVQVKEREHSAADVGDEPLLLAAFAPTWVSRDRAKGVQAAEQNGATVILLDDGFQNPSVSKDVSIVVVDAASGFGNGRVIPAGPLREPVTTGLSRADLVLTIGNKTAQSQFENLWGGQISTPRARGELMPLQTGMDWAGQNFLAFAGIGKPAKFFATLQGLGANLLRTESLDDHQPLSDALMKRLELESAALNAQLVTTEKDAVRLPPAFRSKVLTLPVRLELSDWGPVDDALGPFLARPKS